MPKTKKKQSLTVPGAEAGDSAISPAYERLGVRRGWEPTDVQRLRYWVTGAPGHGKTHFVMSNSQALVIDPEDSSRDVARPRAAVATITNAQEGLAVIRKLVEDGPESSGFKHIVFDTIDKFVWLLIRQMTDEWNATHDTQCELITSLPKGKGWGMLADRVFDLLNDIYMAGYGWTVVGHTIEKEDGEGGFRMRPVLQASIMGPIYREAQMMLAISQDLHHERVKSDTTKKGYEKRLRPVVTLDIADIDQESTTGRDLKARYLNCLPDHLVIPPYGGWSAWRKVYERAIRETRSSLAPTRRE